MIIFQAEEGLIQGEIDINRNNTLFDESLEQFIQVLKLCARLFVIC
jgi:hypothetical protein